MFPFWYIVEVNVGDCVDSCVGVADGLYTSCASCHVYVSCMGGHMFGDMPCPHGSDGPLQWDDSEKKCVWDSTTCNTSKYQPGKTQIICITFIQCWTNVEDVGPTLYKCYRPTTVLCLLGNPVVNQYRHLEVIHVHFVFYRLIVEFVIRKTFSFILYYFDTNIVPLSYSKPRPLRHSVRR